jgi:hypothetical protein
MSDAGELRLVALAPGVTPRGALRALIGETRLDAPPGGCRLLDTLGTPDGHRFLVLGFHGDAAWWQGLVEMNAARQQLLTAEVEGDWLVLSDGREFPLGECAAEGHRHAPGT